MAPDPHRAYNAGVVQVSLNHACAALTGAFGAALMAEGYDSPLVQAILAAQESVTEAQKLPVDWHA